MSYRDLLREHLSLKDRFVKSNIPKEEIITFGGVELHEKIDFTTFQDDKLSLAHTCIHALFSRKNKFISPIRVGSIHESIVEEMEKRGSEHLKYDKLDK